MKINDKVNTGHSSREEFIKAFNIAFAKSDVNYIVDHVSKDITWNIIGDKLIEGKENFERELRKMSGSPAIVITIEQIVTYGKEGAVRGSMEFESGDVYSFSDFYSFTNTQDNVIQSMASHVIKVR